jgi:glycolate oxidase iron-sulfur subunit
LNIDPNIRREADRCVMCGLCLPHCRTYNKSQNEAESPRGRIALIQALASGRLEADARLRGHLESCLLCRACEAKCTSGVQFGAIMDGARAALAEDRPAVEGGIDLGGLASDKGRQRREATLLWLADKTGLRSLGRNLGITKALGLERFEQLAPRISRPHSWQEYYPATASHQGDVALFTGCFGDMFDQATLDAAIILLNACGYGVHVPASQGCCGALHQHCGDSAQARQLAEQNIAAFGELDIQAVISCATGCGSQLKEYPRTIGKTINVCDINTFLSRIEWPETVRFKPLNKRIAVHEPCSLRNVLKEADSLYTLLQRIPEAQIAPLPGNEQCCGAAGSYMIDQPQMADALRQDKLDAIAAIQPQIVVSANIGCALHIAAGLRQAGIELELLHPVALLARQLESGVSLQP